MSAQSIVLNNSYHRLRKDVDDYLDCKGSQFLNSVKYDLPDKVDYKELNKVLVLDKIADRCEDIEKISNVLNRIVKGKR